MGLGEAGCEWVCGKQVVCGSRPRADTDYTPKTGNLWMILGGGLLTSREVVECAQ